MKPWNPPMEPHPAGSPGPNDCHNAGVRYLGGGVTTIIIYASGCIGGGGHYRHNVFTFDILLSQPKFFKHAKAWV